jgi:hypothetical protein
MVEMLNLRDEDHHDEYESDDDSTIVPDNRSVADQEVADLTNEGNGSGENNSDSQLNSTGFPSNDAAEGSLFVDDDDYIVSHPPSPQDGRHSWDVESNQTSQASERSSRESDLFVGSAPTYTNETPSRVPTLRQSSLDSEIEIIDLTGPDDPVDSFLPSYNLNSPPQSRKRPLFKTEDDEDDDADDEDDEDDTSSGTPSSSKRVRTSSPASLLRTITGDESIFFST